MKLMKLRGTLLILMLFCLGLVSAGSVLAVETAIAATAPPTSSLPVATDGAVKKKVPPKRAPHYTDRLIVKFKDPSLAQAKVVGSGTTKALSARAGVTLSHHRSMSGGGQVFKMPKRMTHDEALAVAEKLEADPNVEYAVPDQILVPQQTPNDPSYSSQWDLKSPTADGEAGGINLPLAWDITTGADDTVIAVMDTGIVNHADLDGRVLPGYNFISDPLMAGNGVGRSADATDFGDGVTMEENNDPNSPFYACYVQDSSWHGTRVAGVIAAASNNATGVAGINWRAKILPVRVLGKCGGYLSDAIDGMRWAAGIPVSGVPDNPNPAKIINMSLGDNNYESYPGCSATLQSAINDVIAAGTVVVAAAGNSNQDVARSTPGSCKGVVSVAAVDRAGGATSYTNYGAVTIAAPGGEQTADNDPAGILSPVNAGTTTPIASPDGDTYRFFEGTSIAAAHVSGVASLLLAVRPTLTPSQVTQILQATARPFPTGTNSLHGDGTTSRYGAGIVDAYQAVSAVATAAPLIGAAPLFLDFFTHVGDPNPASQTLAVSNPGNGTLSWNVSSNAAWLRVTPTSGQGGGTVTVSVDTTGLLPTDPNTAAITITAAGAANSAVTIPVKVKYLLKTQASMPYAVSDHVLTAVGDKIYAIGGNDQYYPSNHKRVQIYDAISDSWSQGAPKPNPAVYVNGAVIAGKIYIPGGYDNQTGAMSDMLEIYDPATNSWSSGAPLPMPLVGAAVEAVNGKLYVIGGYNAQQSEYASTYAYDPANNAWSRMADMGATGRSFFSSTVMAGKIYIFGGDSTDEKTALVYDPAANSWSAAASMNKVRSTPGIASLGGKIYAFGGHNTLDTYSVYSTDYFQDSDLYLPGTNSWSAPSLWLNTPRDAQKAVAVRNRIYVIGGETPSQGGGFGPSNRNESYTDPSLPVDGVCGTANGKSLASPPTTNLCFSGTASAVTGSGTWNWTCTGATGTTASCSAVSSLTITGTGALPDARQGIYYNGYLTATGGLSPYTWSFPSGGLPSGLSLNTSVGMIYGYPSASGSYGFTVQLTDAAGTRINKALSLNIKLPPIMVARFPPVYFTLLSNAYSAVANGDTLKLNGTVGFTQDVRFNRDVNFILGGGYNDDFTASSGSSLITGKLTFANGRVKLDTPIRIH